MKKTLKKLVLVCTMTVALFFVMSVSVFYDSTLPVITAMATEEEEEEFIYEVINDEARLREYNGEGGKVVIPAEFEGYPVTTIYHGAFRYNDTITEVAIPCGVKCIDNEAFASCSELKKINIPDSVTEIGAAAFFGCSSLTEITIPGSVKTIEDEVFSGCSSLIEVIICNGVTKISVMMFEECNSLRSIIIPESVTAIGETAFLGCENLERVEIADGITYVGGFAFEGTAYLKNENNWKNDVLYLDYCLLQTRGSKESYEIKSGTKVISAMAFNFNSNLRTLVLPDGLKTIGSYAFESCDSLESINIPDSLTYLGNAVFNSCGNLKNVTLGKGITEIPYGTFSCCNIKSIVIPDGVVTIGSDAFYGNALSEIVIPDSVTQIGNGAFSGTDYLENEDNWEDGILYIDNCLIKVKEDVTECEIKEDTRIIADWAFKDCKNPLDIVIPDSVINIGEAFCYCRTLHSVAIGKGITDIGSRAFYENSKLKFITIGENVKSIGEDAFNNCTSLAEIIIPENVESIGEDAFKGCTGLVCVSVEDIASWCKMDFDGFNGNPLCNGGDLYLNGQLITELIIPEGVTEIAKTAFYECSAITSVVFPESLKNIGRLAFYGCNNVTTLDFNEGIENIGEEAFYECRNITSVVIPESVESIGYDAFECCDNLKSVYINDLTSWCNIDFDGYGANPMNEKADLYLNGIMVTELIIPDGITDIGRFAFNGCRSIKSVVMPDSVKSIGENAFRSCSYLENIVLSDSINVIERGTFSFCNNLQSIVIPEGVNIIKENAFSFCNNLQSIVIPEGVNTIKECTFDSCDNLKSVTIPSTVTVIEGWAFDDCDSLSGVYYGATKAQWNKIEKEDYNDALYNAVIHCTDGDIDSNHEHSYESEITKQPTCTSTGTKVFTCSCGESYTETLGVSAHKAVTDKAVSATCTKTGLTEGSHCSVCNAVIKKQTTISKKSHSSDKGTVTKAATYKLSGIKTYKCTACKTVIKTEIVKHLSLAKVNGLKATPATTSIKVSWSKVTGAEKYEVYYSTNGKKWTKITSSKNNVTIKKLKKITNYKIKVRSVAGENTGSYSSILSATTVPGKVTMTDLRSKKSKILTPVWKPVSGVTGYEVVYSTSKKFTKKTTKTVRIKKAKTKKTTIKKLKKGKKYYVKVRAYKTVSGKKIYGAYSSIKSVKVK